MRHFLAPALLAVSILAAWPAVSAPANLSSHTAAFFEELLAGRVVVYRWPGSGHPRERTMTWGAYYDPDGGRRSCTAHFRKDRAGDYRHGKHMWRMVRASHARLHIHSEHSKGSQRRIFYDPPSGRLHTEKWDNRVKQWQVWLVGWVQDAWPQVLADGCSFRPPVPINEKQTAPELEALLAQDPDAPIRHFPGSELRVPGAVGQAMTEGQPTLSRAELSEFMRAHHGRILLSFRGRPRVLVVRADKEELWALNSAGAVTNVGHFQPSPDGETIGMQWERGEPPRYRYEVGYALPYAPTGQQFGAFQLGDWLLQQPQVTLPYFGLDATFRFGAGGKLETLKRDGRWAEGTWRWSRGDLQLRFPEVSDIATYEWRGLAKRLGWSPSSEVTRR